MEQEFITRRQIEAAIEQARAALEQIGWDADAGSRTRGLRINISDLS